MGKALQLSVWRVGLTPFVELTVIDTSCPSIGVVVEDGETHSPWFVVTEKAVEVPLVTIAPEISSRHFANSAISARDDAQTADGAIPITQDMWGSELPLEPGVCDQR